MGDWLAGRGVCGELLGLGAFGPFGTGIGWGAGDFCRPVGCFCAGSGTLAGGYWQTDYLISSKSLIENNTPVGINLTFICH